MMTVVITHGRWWKTNQQQPGPTTTARRGRRIGTVLSATVLVLANLVTPEGPGDSSRIDGAWFTAFAGAVLALLTAMLTVIPVMARWLGKRWFLVPAVLFVVATARWVVIDQMYPEPDWSARSGVGAQSDTVMF